MSLEFATFCGLRYPLVRLVYIYLYVLGLGITETEPEALASCEIQYCERCLVTSYECLCRYMEE
jgi:hypothetical protein